MENENNEIKIGASVSYWDQANSKREGIITRIIKKESGNCFLLFGGKTPMEPINEEIEIIYPGSWHKSIVPSNGIKDNEHAGHQLVNKPTLTQDQVNNIISEYERMQPILRAEREQTKHEKQLEKEKQKEQYKIDYPFLICASNSKLSSAALGAKNLKTELQRAYPGVNFSVKSEYYSMGCSIDVRWNFGPVSENVRKIANKYQEGHFDGMEDLYTYSDQVFTDVFGGAKYVCCQREEKEA